MCVFDVYVCVQKHVCDARSLPSAVVESHLLQAFRADLPLDMDRAGLTPAIRDAILSIVQSAPINSSKGTCYSCHLVFPLMLYSRSVNTQRLTVGSTAQ